MPQDVLHDILSSPASLSRINDVLPNALILSSIGLTSPIFQESSKMAIVVWSSVGAATGLVLVLVAVFGFCLANYSRLVAFKISAQGKT